MYRVFTYRNSYKYLDILQHLVDSYNHSVHRSHGFAPANVTEADEPMIYKSLYNISSPIRFRFSVNDVVRISKARKVFKKGYLPGWTEETFTIYKRYPTNPPTYVLQDSSGKEIAGRFYEEELQKINKTSNDFWAIEKIIRTKGRGSSRHLLVKWVGFDDSFNSWIKAEWLKT
ncbi:chromo domain-containing protein [Trichonephila clavipes]|nr:chromo domain-containing protein [Trichonephila clavipes]